MLYAFYNLGLIDIRKANFRGCIFYEMIAKKIPSLRRYIRYIFLSDTSNFSLTNDVIICYDSIKGL